MRESMIRLLVAAAAVLVAVVFMSTAVALSRPPVQVAPAQPPAPVSFTITGTCTVTAAHAGQTVSYQLDGQTTVDLATPGSITAPGCTIE